MERRHCSGLANPMFSRVRTHKKKGTTGARRMAEPKGWAVGTAVLAGCKGTPLLRSGKERLDFLIHSLQLLVVMHDLLAAAAGWDAAPDPLLRHHLTDCVPVIPLIPNHRCRRRPILPHPSSARAISALPLPQVQPSGTTFAQTPWSLLVMPPDPSGEDQTPLVRLDAVGWVLRAVASSISTSGAGASDADTSEKNQIKDTLV